MADRVLYQTDDDLSQDNLKNTQYRQNAVDYVERGLTLSNYDSSGLTVDLSSGHCVVDAGSGAAYDVFPDSRSGISLTDSATNDIYVSIDPTTQDSISVSSLTSGTPSDPSVKVGEVDTSADSVSDVNRDPDASFETVSTGETRTTEDFHLDHSQNSPFFPQTLEKSGPITVRPHPHADNPVLTASDVSDVSSVNGVADPFIRYHDGEYVMIHEILAADFTIGYATSPDGLNWTYQSEILADVEHSYPHFFKINGTWYMTPTQRNQDEIRVYKADTFPTSWSLHSTPLSTTYSPGDPQPFKYNGTWFWLIHDETNSNKRLYYHDSWPPGDDSLTEHPSSPVESDPRHFKNAGRPIVSRDQVQIFNRTSGINDYETNSQIITTLDKNNYSASEPATSPVLTQSSRTGAWDENEVHHIDPVMPYVGGTNIVVIDGRDTTNENWKIGIYTISEQPTGPTAATLSSSQTISDKDSGGFQTVTFDERIHDYGSHFDTSNNEYVVPTSGYYKVTLVLTFNLVSDGTRMYGRILEDGNELTRQANTHGDSEQGYNSVVSTITTHFDAGTKIKASAWQDSGGGLDLVGNKGYTSLSVKRVW